MEMWILLAAVGSGYLMQYWQKSRAYTIDDDESSGISRQVPSMRKCGNSFPERRTFPYGCNKSSKDVCVMDNKENVGESQVLQHDDIEHACCCSSMCKFHSQGFSLSDSCLARCERCSITCDCCLSADQCSSKCIEDVLNDEMVSEGEFSLCHEIPWLNFWDTCQHASDIQEERCYFNIESKSRTRSRVFRVLEKSTIGRGYIIKKNNATQKQMTSLESCLWAQMHEETSQSDTFGFSSNRYGGGGAIKALGSAQGNGGFSLCPRKLRLRMSATRAWDSDERLAMKRAAGDTSEGSLWFPCFPPLSYSRRWRKRSKPSSDPFSVSHSCNFQGDAKNALNGLLFNFGLGVGIMFTILSDRLATKELLQFLEEAMGLLEDVESQIRNGQRLNHECSSPRECREDASRDQRAKMLRDVKGAMSLVEQVRVSLADDVVHAPATDPALQKEMAKLEAELQEELERMEQSLNNRDTSRTCQTDLSSMECDTQVGTLVEGDLSARGIPHEVEVELEDENGRDCFCQKDAHLRGDHTVSPVELALRLHEVLKGRQEQHISNLEAEVKDLLERLQAKEVEVQYWKQRSLFLLPGVASESCPSAKRKVGTQHNSPSSSPRCNMPFFNSCEDYDEICDEFCHLWGGTATSGSSLVVSSQPHSSSRDWHARDRDLDWLCRGSIGEDDEHSSQSSSTGSTPAVKFMGKQTHPCNPLEAHSTCKVDSRESTLREEHLIREWAGGQDPCHSLEAPVCYQDKPALLCGAHQDVIDIFEAHDGQDGRAVEWCLSEDRSYTSDVDEQMGRLLIKRIVEKSRKGSSLVEVAHSVMASFDGDGTI